VGVLYADDNAFIIGDTMLRQVLKRLEDWDGLGKIPVIVFDLDSTLFDTAARHYKILCEFAEGESQSFQKVVNDISITEFGWSVTAPLEARGANDPAVLGRLLAYWKTCFFTNEYVLADQPSKGAVSFVQEVHRLGALVYYLTGRDVPQMGVGTASALTKAGFPLWRGRTVLHLKPSFEMPDKDFKGEAIKDILSHGGEVVATFDNEPENCNLFQAAFPDALNVCFGSVHSPNSEPLDARIRSVVDFSISR
jgi:hypothetical protein